MVYFFFDTFDAMIVENAMGSRSSIVVTIMDPIQMEKFEVGLQSQSLYGESPS